MYHCTGNVRQAFIERAYRTSYWSSIGIVTSVLLLSCRISEILELWYAESHFSVPNVYSCQNFREQIRDVGACEANKARNYFRKIPTYVIKVFQRQ